MVVENMRYNNIALVRHLFLNDIEGPLYRELKVLAVSSKYDGLVFRCFTTQRYTKLSDTKF